MQCPACSVALGMRERSGVEIDYCPKCRGIWLDRCERDDAFDGLLARVRGEYLEMPGLRLTVAQASRLWGLDAAVCDALLTCLEASGFLRQTAVGAFRLASSDRAVPRMLHRSSPVAEDRPEQRTPTLAPKQRS